MNGDGTPDVVIQEYVPSGRGADTKRAATLPLELLSGRTGRVLWKAGALPVSFDARGYSPISSIDARAVERGGAPDLFVRHDSPFLKPSAAPSPGPTRPGRPSLARISGRDGRVLWDIPLAGGAAPTSYQHVAQPHFVDFNGDGGLDALVMVPPLPSAGQPEYRLLAISLRDGKRLWSQPLGFEFSFGDEIHVGDLDGDSRPEVVVMGQPEKGENPVLELRALHGHDGKVRWAWNTTMGDSPSRIMALADLEGAGVQSACLSFKEPGGRRRILVLDGAGKERSHLDVPDDRGSTLNAMDLDGDGRDELLARYDGQVRALGSDLKERWSWAAKSGWVQQFLPKSAERPCTVLIPPALALDGATGQPRWTGQAPLAQSPPTAAPSLLDPGNATRYALLISSRVAETVCQVAMPTTPQGAIAPPRGTLVQPRQVSDDPRLG